MRQRLMQFMQGRYGNDQLNRFLMAVGMVFLVISLFGPDLFYTLALVILIYTYFRMFSRNIYKRAAENQKYLQKSVKIRGILQKKKKELMDLKTHHIYKCPGCKQKLRVPRGRGRIEISCRKCGTKFVKKS